MKQSGIYFFNWRRASLILASLVFVSLYIFSCQKDEAGLQPQRDTSRFEQLARAFVDTARLPLTLKEIRVEQEVAADELEAVARELILHSAFINYNADGQYSIVKALEGGLPGAQVEEKARILLDHNFLTAGDLLLLFEWTADNGKAFTTLGVMAPDGTPRFEPILQFNGIVEENEPIAFRNGWAWGPWKRTVTNGFGMECVTVEWTVDISTSPDGCNIVDPGPHIEITKQQSNCPFWEQHTTKGETLWCNPREECVCQLDEYGEDCIKWVVVTYVATGFSDIEVDLTASGSIRGIDLEGSVSFNASRFGAEATYETVRNLCAKSGAI